MSRESFNRRLTSSGDPAAERAMTDDLRVITEKVLAVLGDSLAALVLVGSYARGEGAVQRHGSRWVGHNDFDLVCVMKDKFVRRYHDTLRKIAAECKEQVLVDVDLWPISRSDLATAPQTLFWLDVSMGGARVLHGESTVLDPLRGRSSRDISMDECARLLANRASGLALSRLGGTWSSPDICARHMHKAVLACGDARLLSVHRYASTLGDRSSTLATICSEHPTLHQLPSLYQDAIAYRSAPGDWKPTEHRTVSEWYTETQALVSKWHLQFEEWRVGVAPDPIAYARFSQPIYSQSADVQRLRSVVHSLKCAVQTGSLRWIHPREQLARASVAIAYAPTERLAELCNETLFCEQSSSLQALERLVHHGG